MPCLRAYAPSGIRTHDPLITSREHEPLHHSAPTYKINYHVLQVKPSFILFLCFCCRVYHQHGIMKKYNIRLKLIREAPALVSGKLDFDHTLWKPKRHSLRCHDFMVHASLLRMCTNVVYFRVMQRLCRREWTWLWNWRCVNQHPWDPWQRTMWSRRVMSDFNSVFERDTFQKSIAPILRVKAIV